jgi:hypothetical protein
MDKNRKVLKGTRKQIWRDRLVLKDFLLTLSDFCATTLSRGVQRGDEWVVGDLDNSAGDSCYVNLRKGVWCDHATGEKGTAETLWTKLFGVEDHAAIIDGMEAWCRDGTLPDGTDIGGEPEQQAVLTPERKLPWYYKHNQEMADRWLAAVEDNRICVDIVSEQLSEYRRLSVEVFRWLVNEGYVGWFESEKTRKGGGETWTGADIAFPVTYETPEAFYFFGLHLKWIGKEKSGWLYLPKGIPAMPLMIGNPIEEAERIIIGESTWDIVAAIDLYRIWESGVKWTAISTRGATNLSYVPFKHIRKEARIKLLRQNDEAGSKFVQRIPEKIYERSTDIVPPDELKDLNDWMKRDGREFVLESLRNRYKYEDR